MDTTFTDDAPLNVRTAVVTDAKVPLVLKERRGLSSAHEGCVGGVQRIDASQIVAAVTAAHSTYNSNRNRKLEISTAPTKAKSWESAYSHALIKN